MENPNQTGSRRRFLRAAAGSAWLASSGPLVTRMAAQLATRVGRNLLIPNKAMPANAKS